MVSFSLLFLALLLLFLTFSAKLRFELNGTLSEKTESGGCREESVWTEIIQG